MAISTSRSHAPSARAGQQVAALADPAHRQLEAPALLAEDRRVRHPHVLEDSDAGPHSPIVSIGADVQPAVAVDEEAGDAAVGALLLVGDREDHDEVGLVAAGDERLLAVDDPLVALAAGAGADVAGVGAGAGLGDREAAVPRRR